MNIDSTLIRVDNGVPIIHMYLYLAKSTQANVNSNNNNNKIIIIQTFINESTYYIYIYLT